MITNNCLENKELETFCPWHDKDLCGECDRSKNSFAQNCSNEEMFNDMTCRCPECSEGILNPSFSGVMACDKCGIIISIEELLKKPGYDFLEGTSPKKEESLIIELMVRHDHHQGIPTFQCTATSWEEANEKLKKGFDEIKEQNQKYIDKYESQYALICGIIDFKVIDSSGEKKGQFGFSIDTICNKTIRELYDWYVAEVM